MSGYAVAFWSINAVTVVASAVAVWYAVQARQSSARTRRLLHRR